MKRLVYGAIALLVLVYATAFVSYAGPVRKSGPAPRLQKQASDQWQRISAELRAEGFSQAFISELKPGFTPELQEKILNLNVLSFLRTSNHQALVTPLAVERTRQFLQEHRDRLAHTHSVHGVPPEVISALLWIETRHGSITGKYPVGGVYLSLYLGREKSWQNRLYEIARKTERGQATPVDELRAKIQLRSERKSAWALGQLKALDQMRTRHGVTIPKLNGSFAGAFGVPQFIPQSFLSWAATADVKRAPDLSRADDAIFSVANYLKIHGWAGEREARKKALMAYNNSSDYAEAILELADLALDKPT